MTKKALLQTLVLTLLVFVSAMTWAAKGPKKLTPANKITDAAGRTHVRPMGRITEAQRKAAAQRRKNNVRARNTRAVTPVTGVVR